MLSEKKTLQDVKDYYGKVLQGTKDLQTTACCTAESMPKYLREIVSQIHPEVLERFYGCGSPIPQSLGGQTVLDLGSGSGRDCFLLSKLVGERGRVIGIDMTNEQLEVARRHIPYHAERFGYAKPNVSFLTGYIEDLAGAGIASESIDVITSNCVVNLSPDKRRVFAEAFRVLKPGGELYFSDVFSAQRIPTELAADPVLLGECLSGALYTEDFRRIMTEVGFLDFRVVSKTPIAMTNPEVEAKIGMINFFSITIRAFKLPLEDRCEDYGQVAYYKGTIQTSPHAFMLDDHHLFLKGKPSLVCGNTADMLSATRFREHFRIEGNKATHFGLFDCGPNPVQSATAGGSCC